MSLTIFEQSWTKTLEISEASLMANWPKQDGDAVKVSLVNAEAGAMKLDAEEFERFAAARSSAAATPKAEPAKEKQGWKEWAKAKLDKLRRRA